MALDKEQRRILKAFLPGFGGWFVSSLILLWTGTLDSWKDFLIFLGIGLVVFTLIASLFTLGSRTPRKDD